MNRIFTLFIILLVVSACTEKAPPVEQTATSAADSNGVPPPPDREPFRNTDEFDDIFEVVCHLGHPLQVSGWAQGPDARFVMFAGPVEFRPGSTYDYLIAAIVGPDRRDLDGISFIDGPVSDNDLTKPDELARYQIPIIAGIDENISVVLRKFGEPDMVQQRSSGERYFFMGPICLGEQLIEGMFLDVVDGNVSKASGKDHPFWIRQMMNGRGDMPPDAESTWYEDFAPVAESAQEKALEFVFARAKDGKDAASKYLTRGSGAQSAEPALPGARVVRSSLQYKTTRYGEDVTEMELRYYVSNSRDNSRSVMDLLTLVHEDGDWRVGASSREISPCKPDFPHRVHTCIIQAEPVE